MTEIPGFAAWVSAAVPGSGRVVRVEPGEGGRVRCAGARAAPGALPVADSAADTVVLDRVLPRLPDPAVLFAEVRRVLRPAGSVVVVVPAPGRSPAELRRGLRRGVLAGRWACPVAVEHPAWMLTAQDFAVLGDDRALFDVPGPDPAALVAAGVWPPLDAAARRTVDERLDRLSGRALAVGFRRVVGRR